MTQLAGYYQSVSRLYSVVTVLWETPSGLGAHVSLTHTLIKRLGIPVHSFCEHVSTYPSLEVAYGKI